jgi:mannose-6-phosphate isomerase-like protein (cupin superfamily)
MPIEIKRFDVRRFSEEKLQKVNLFQTPRFFFDVYCLLTGQSQKPHRHEGADKVYAVLDGEVVVQVGEETALVGRGQAVLAPAGVDHAVENRGPEPAAVLVFMAPRP